jgi:hypothetical protein
VQVNPLLIKYLAHVNSTFDPDGLNKVMVVRNEQYRTLEVAHRLGQSGQVPKINVIRWLVHYQNRWLLQAQAGQGE